MSLADQASILLIPSGYKSQKLYSIFPTNGEGDFNFSRSGSATRIAQNGLITTVDSNVPRLDYLDGSCPSLLLENQSTNLFEYSEDFSDSYWNTSRAETPYIADILSPDGTLNAYTLEIESGQTNGGGVYAVNISVSGGSSISVFAKKKIANYLVLSDSGTTTNAVYFDLENGAIGTTYNATGEIEDFGNGWYRCTMKYTLTSSGLKFIYLSNVDGATNGGVQPGDSIYIYGAQLENQSFSTSYIPTNGATSTRLQDIANNSGNSTLINSTEGVLYAECSLLNPSTGSIIISLSDGGSNKLYFEFFTSNRLYAIIENGSSSFNTVQTITQTDYNKIAFKYSASDCKLYVNGIGYSFGGLNFPSGTLDRLNFASSNGTSSKFFGKVKDIRVYNSELSDSELQSLTT